MVFDVVHEFAVLGTACFMTAVHLLWFSFGWLGDDAESKTELANTDILRNLIFFVLAVGMIAVALPFAAQLVSNLVWVGLGMAVLTACLLSVVQSPARLAWQPLVGQALFVLVFMVGTVGLLVYWPW